MQQPTKTRNERTGAAAVELALVLPLFLLIVFGIIEFGRAMSAQQLVTTAARDACRRATLQGATNDSITTSATDFLTRTIVSDGASVQVMITIERTAANNLLTKAIPGDVISVETRIPFGSIGLLPDSCVPAVLRSSCTMIHE